MFEAFDTRKSILQELSDPLFELHNCRVWIKRDDLIHEEVSGNKWRKLKYNILKAINEKKDGILTFGGAYSNHLVATAAACKQLGLLSVGIVRGDELDTNSNDTLRRCSEYGMKLVFVSRVDYGQKDERYFMEELLEEHGNLLIVPEGGANYYGIIGSQEIVDEPGTEIDECYIAQGTTTTSCGVLLGLPEEATLHVVPVLKGFNALQEMRALLSQTGMEQKFIDDQLGRVKVLDNFHFGGYARYTQELLYFIRDSYIKFGIKLDPVYTGKAFYAMIDDIRRGESDDRKILFIHTGGIQGAEPIEEQAGFDLYPLFS